MGIPGDWYPEQQIITDNNYLNLPSSYEDTKKRRRSDLEIDKGFKRLRVGNHPPVPPADSMLRLPSIPDEFSDADYTRVNAVLGLLHNERTVRKIGHTPQFRTV
mmetsp:Transcript_8044/g.11219  ORF Transcript_8044/g.11219 Transcript_8044/m.11219 type:complete len:104 (+) Transcript_8044:84-395(+)|eukprot:CAMPEP_0197285970 /NCGR_PEP_ID=MMETSP0890-20130614/1347_1 /TAXON_ID=44058 ORGANISM="Aureoumbra lagunensis, Strain CCMP1510" /NCGR_SAMPLE_ID=MMETSP0890 /ASSEMBLY_ACC=CAM_ASM_000533 /LENGTH=103 /DNA_ID=CAMNT_0042753913 /DNA_START=71 /DNA_END=382 /DNA_ORIENTATION=-